MRKRIDTQFYDTETAKKIGTYLHGYDDNASREILYKKRTGEYFLYGKGGPTTKWAKTVDTTYISGEDIRPLTYEEAKSWFEKANNDDPKLATDEVYNREFGKIKDNEVKEATTIRLSRPTKRKLEKLATEQGKSQSEIIENLILSSL